MCVRVSDICLGDSLFFFIGIVERLCKKRKICFLAGKLCLGVCVCVCLEECLACMYVFLYIIIELH